MFMRSIAIDNATTHTLPAATRTDEVPLRRLIYLATDENVSEVVTKCARFAVINEIVLHELKMRNVRALLCINNDRTRI